MPSEPFEIVYNPGWIQLWDEIEVLPLLQSEAAVTSFDAAENEGEQTFLLSPIRDAGDGYLAGPKVFDKDVFFTIRISRYKIVSRGSEDYISTIYRNCWAT